MKIKLISSVTLLCATSSLFASETLFVKPNNLAIQDGLSWSSAFSSIQDALSQAQPGQDIWVAKGTYYPTQNLDRKISFELKSGINIYGGFFGNEEQLNQRDWQQYPSILSGDIGIKNDMTDNTEHVVVGADNSIIDGFIIRDGYTLDKAPNQMAATGENGGPPPKGENGGPPPKGENGGPPPKGDNSVVQDNTQSDKAQGPSMTPEAVLSAGIGVAGAGMVNFQTSPRIQNVLFINNQAPKAGAVYNVSPKEGNPVFINVSFEDNYAWGRGGAIVNDLGANPIFVNTSFINNKTDDKGGAVYNDFGCSPIFYNVLFSQNQANTAAAMGNDGTSSPLIVHGTFVNNTAIEAGSVLYQGTYKADLGDAGNKPKVINSIIWDNPVTSFGSGAIYNWSESRVDISYSLVQGNANGEGNINQDPLFINADKQDYRLSKESPAINAGTQGLMPFPQDLAGFVRDKQADMGAFEWSERKGSLSATEIQTQLADLISQQSKQQDDKKDHREKEGKNKMEDAWAGLSLQEKAEPQALSNNIIFVNPANKTAPYNGTSWANAFQDLQHAMVSAKALGGAQIWLAQGTYLPTQSKDRSVSFELSENIAIFGGFKGNESRIEERTLESDTTILSGNIGDEGTALDNSYHVIKGASNSTLNNLTIADGYANGDGINRHGGGLLNYNQVSSIQLDNVTLRDNYAINGGAIYHFYFGFISIKDSSFINNSADFGGAFYANVAVNGLLENLVFEGNKAAYRGGAVVIDYGSANTFNKVIFKNNSTPGKGGAVWTNTRASQTDFSQPTFKNSQFINNQAGLMGGAIHNYNQSITTISNTRFSDNKAPKGSDLGNELKATFKLKDNQIDLTGTASAFYSDDSSSEITLN